MMMRISNHCRAAAFVLTLAVVPASPQSKLPAGKGSDLVERECTKCHGLEGITRARNTKERWADVVDDMVSRGATGTDEEIDRIIDYLAANFGKPSANSKAEAPRKVNVNRATASELAVGLELSDEDASAMVHYREKNGNFKDAEDLKKVPGVNAKWIEDKKARLEF